MPEEKKTVVCVEDEPEMIDLVKLILGRKGFELVGAVGGREGLETVRKLKPDLVLLDLMMPEETGTGLYRKLHDKKAYKEIPVIVISGAAGRDVAVSKSVPVFDKPIDKEALLSKIQETVGAA